MVEPLHAHWVAAKHVLRYLHGTINHGLRYIVRDLRLHGYTDDDWVGNVVDRKSTSRCFFTLRFAVISWMNRKQTSVVLSMTEAVYIVASMDNYEAVWLRKLFGKLFEQVMDTTVIYCDNKSGF